MMHGQKTIKKTQNDRFVRLYVLIIKVLNGTREDKCQFKLEFIYWAQIPISRRISDLLLTVIHKYNIFLVRFVDRTQQCVSHHPCFRRVNSPFEITYPW
jgi:hypothetical protein